MLKQRKKQNNPSLETKIKIAPWAAYSPEVRGGGGLLFHELYATHHRLNASHFRVALEVTVDGGKHRFQDIIETLYPEATKQEAATVLANLWSTGLFLICDGEEDQPEQAGRKPAHHSLSVKQDAHLPPLWMLVCEFALANLLFQANLRIRGWKQVVAPIRLTQPVSTIEEEVRTLATPSAIVEHLLAAASLAYGLPCVSSLCAPVACSFYRMLKRRGYPCSLEIGSPPAPLWPHIWVEMDGYVIDTTHYHYEESRYRPMHEIQTHEEIMHLFRAWDCCQD